MESDEVAYARIAEIDRLRAELAAMKKQRDEARRGICRAIAYERAKLSGVFDPKRVAIERGWDCYAEKEGGGA